mmetsp:Transcript_125292/g.348617  ORF Transcript_125292/g.348617 Transcript_125292/m.348617 type:complete len:230 (+) Transcript_125292:1147-1836(+)
MLSASSSFSSSSLVREAVAICSSANAWWKASTMDVDVAALSFRSTLSSMIAARRMRSMTLSRLRSFASLISNVTERLAYRPKVRCIAGRQAPRRPRATAETSGPLVCTKMYFVRRKRPLPKPIRRMPNITMSLWDSTQRLMPSIELSPPPTSSSASGSACNRTQFQGPRGSHTALSASRPVVKMSFKECLGIWGPLAMAAPLPSKSLVCSLEDSLGDSWKWRSCSLSIH